MMNTAPVFLLVEPYPTFRLRLRICLEQVFVNPTIFITTNGTETLRLITQEQPSHILIEMELSDISGLEVLRQIRQVLPDARIVATSWHENHSFLNEVRSAGANGFIRKPTLPSGLLDLWEIPPELRMDNGKTSPRPDH